MSARMTELRVRVYLRRYDFTRTPLNCALPDRQLGCAAQKSAAYDFAGVSTALAERGVLKDIRVACTGLGSVETVREGIESLPRAFACFISGFHRGLEV